MLELPYQGFSLLTFLRVHSRSVTRFLPGRHASILLSLSLRHDQSELKPTVICSTVIKQVGISTSVPVSISWLMGHPLGMSIFRSSRLRRRASSSWNLPSRIIFLDLMVDHRLISRRRQMTRPNLDVISICLVEHVVRTRMRWDTCSKH